MINQGFIIEYYDKHGERHREHLSMTDSEYIMYNVINEWMWRSLIPTVDFSNIGPHPVVHRNAFVIFAVSHPQERLVLMELDHRYYFTSVCVDCGYENYGNSPPSKKYRDFYFCQGCRRLMRQILGRLGFKKMEKKLVK